MPGVRELSEQLWLGEVSTTEIHPVHTRVSTGEEIDDGLFYYKGIASVNAIDTGDGLAMLDTGASTTRPRLLRGVRGWRPGRPGAAAVYSHHHVDHVFGTRRSRPRPPSGWPAPVVYAHEAVPANFRRYQNARLEHGDQ